MDRLGRSRLCRQAQTCRHYSRQILDDLTSLSGRGGGFAKGLLKQGFRNERDAWWRVVAGERPS